MCIGTKWSWEAQIEFCLSFYCHKILQSSSEESSSEEESEKEDKKKPDAKKEEPKKAEAKKAEVKFSTCFCAITFHNQKIPSLVSLPQSIDCSPSWLFSLLYMHSADIWCMFLCF